MHVTESPCLADPLFVEDRYQIVEESVAMHSTIGDHMTEETLVHSSNPTFESFPIMTKHHCSENEYQITPVELDTVEYEDPMYMDISMVEGSPNYEQ